MTVIRQFGVGLSLLTLISTPALGQFDIEGVFTGEMDLYENEGELIPIEVALALTGEEEIVDGETRQIIDGAFLVDEEGGPYSFAKVTFEFEEARLDLRYNRPELNFGDVPASFRLVGEINNDGQITGKVLSGVRGRIGDFVLEKADELYLNPEPKYVGTWSGRARTTGGGEVPMRIVLEDSFQNSINPTHFEFEFTPAKVGHVKWNRIRLGVNQVAIDYLRRQVIIFHNDGRDVPSLAVEFQLSMNTGVASGRVNSTGRGTTAAFDLSPDYFPYLGIFW